MLSALVWGLPPGWPLGALPARLGLEEDAMEGWTEVSCVLLCLTCIPGMGLKGRTGC